MWVHHENSALPIVRQAAAGDGESLHEIVCHLADAEVANAWRYRKVFAEDEFAPTTWDQDRWAAAHNYRRQDLRLALEQLRTLRARNVALMKLVGRKAWSRTALHPTLGPLSAEQIFTHQVHHGANHVAQIERIRKALKSREPGTRRSAGLRTPSERRVAASRG